MIGFRMLAISGLMFVFVVGLEILLDSIDRDIKADGELTLLVNTAALTAALVALTWKFLR